MTTWRPEDRLKLLSELLDEMARRDKDVVILVEGQRDRGGLKLLGVEGEVILVQQSGGIFKVAEELAKNKKKALILTDWDRKGGQLNRLLREALEANAVPYDDKRPGSVWPRSSVGRSRTSSRCHGSSPGSCPMSAYLMAMAIKGEPNLFIGSAPNLEA